MLTDNDTPDLVELALDLDKLYFQMIHLDDEDDDEVSERVRVGAAKLCLLDPDVFNNIMKDVPGCIRVCASYESMQAEAIELSSLHERLKNFALQMHRQDSRFWVPDNERKGD